MKKLLLIPVFVFSVLLINAQEQGYKFENIVDLGVSTVKSQGSTGTCWCFATVSFLESELIRMEKPVTDLSEMYIVKNAYEYKAKLYIGTHGKANFSQGGQAHDVTNEIIDHGIVPESVYNGIQYDSERHSHKELSTVLTNFLDGVLKTRRPSTVWLQAFNAVVEAYLGEDIKSFEFDGKTYTPQTYASEMGIDANNYIEFTSYTNMPYYEFNELIIPDNWSHDNYYNLPLDEFMEVMEHSLKDGYTFVFDGDMSDKGFTRKEGIAVIDDETDEEKTFLKQPVEEKHIDAEFRQAQFESFNITDDHLMHITGLVKDQNGVKYYKTKNSWGEKSGMNGYWNMSEEYMRLHTVAIMVHKDAVPKEILKKIKL